MAGRLWRGADASDAGTYAKIRIRVLDGQRAAALNSFIVAVTQVATCWATLSWNPPTDNGDGTNLTDLAVYRIYNCKSRARRGTLR